MLVQEEDEKPEKQPLKIVPFPEKVSTVPFLARL